MTIQKKPHKHSEIIKVWADGATIQVFLGGWFDAEVPQWDETNEYRVKPEPKPDFIYYAEATTDKVYSYSSDAWSTDNLKLTFDGETGKLKAAEVITK